MSQYFDEKDLFSGPTVEQYGSHMIMKNVKKESKNMYLNIDTKFRDEYNDNFNINYNITLPERINNLKSMYITDVEVPLSYYIISENLENNIFQITHNNTKIIITIPDGDYDDSTLVTKINTILTTNSNPFSDISCSVLDNKFIFHVSSSEVFTLDFNIDTNGCNSMNSMKSRLGWMLGFRKESYTLENQLTSESFIDLYGPKYLFLVVEELSSATSQNGFLSFLSQSRINKSILARLSLERAKVGFNGIHTGDFTSDMREYNGKVDIQKLKVQLIDEFNRVMNLNGRDLSFCLRITYE